MTTSFMPQVIADNSGQWVGNGLRFESIFEARCYVDDLYQRWTLVQETRVIESSDPVNSAWRDGKLVQLHR